MSKAGRDDFSQATKDLLGNRAGWRCSNPDCRKPTRGPNMDPNKVINIGEAAHITAASRGGKRYNEKLTPQERKSVENGIWLCRTCAKLIDSDEQLYTEELIRTWKKKAERTAQIELEQKSAINNLEEKISEYSCINRENINYEKLMAPLIIIPDMLLRNTITVIVDDGTEYRVEAPVPSYTIVSGFPATTIFAQIYNRIQVGAYKTMPTGEFVNKLKEYDTNGYKISNGLKQFFVGQSNDAFLGYYFVDFVDLQNRNNFFIVFYKFERNAGSIRTVEAKTISEMHIKLLNSTCINRDFAKFKEDIIGTV